MSAESACPTFDELVAYASGKAPAANGVRVKGHLDQCTSCRKQLDALSAGTLYPDTPPMHSDAIPMAPELALGSDGGTQKVTSDFAYLKPPLEPDEMGRIGNYRVLGVLGKGGMGVVFRAEDLSLARPVALKVMRPEMKADPDGWLRFSREMRVMAQLKHDHLVTIYQQDKEGDLEFFAMELLEGESLEAWIQRQPRSSVPDILRLGRELATGLAFLHEKNLIHRDIKPANIFLEGPKRRVKILDLGLARTVQESTLLTVTGMIMGTPGFMSPEQARGDDVDAATDIFSLGCVFYNLATGRRPFEGRTASSVLMALASETPPNVCDLNPQIPKDLSDLIMQMLARRPRKRPGSMAEVLRRLEELDGTGGLPMTAVTPAATPSLKRDRTNITRKTVRAKGSKNASANDPSTAGVDPPTVPVRKAAAEVPADPPAPPAKAAKEARSGDSKKARKRSKNRSSGGVMVPLIVGGCALAGIAIGVALFAFPGKNKPAEKKVVAQADPPVKNVEQTPVELPAKKPTDKVIETPTKKSTADKVVETPAKKTTDKGTDKPPPVQPPPPMKAVYLTDLQDVGREHWPFRPPPKDKKGPKDGKQKDPNMPPPPSGEEPVRHKGSPVPHGIFMHPPGMPYDGQQASLSYRLNRQYQTFKADVSINDGPFRSESPCTFSVYGDGVMIWQSKRISMQEQMEPCSISVRNVDLLKITVQCDGPPGGAHAIWIEPRVMK